MFGFDSSIGGLLLVLFGSHASPCPSHYNQGDGDTSVAMDLGSYLNQMSWGEVLQESGDPLTTQSNFYGKKKVQLAGTFGFIVSPEDNIFLNIETEFKTSKFNFSLQKTKIYQVECQFVFE